MDYRPMDLSLGLLGGRRPGVDVDDRSCVLSAERFDEVAVTSPVALRFDEGIVPSFPPFVFPFSSPLLALKHMNAIPVLFRASANVFFTLPR